MQIICMCMHMLYVRQSKTTGLNEKIVMMSQRVELSFSLTGFGQGDENLSKETTVVDEASGGIV